MRLSNNGQKRLEQLISVRSCTLVLAYAHRFAPPLLPRNRFWASTHLRQLATWLARPAPMLKTIRAHRPLLAHFALLQAAGLLQTEGNALYLTPCATDWLHAQPLSQHQHLLGSFRNVHSWQETLDAHGWGTVMTLDYKAYIEQTLQRQPLPLAAGPALAAASKITWNADRLLIDLHDDTPPWLLFDLLQLGDWQPGQPLCCTPLTINQAAGRGYGRQVIFWLLETAADEPITEERQKLLDRWRRQGHSYRLERALLLETAQDCQLAAVLKQARLKPHIKEQISPRHAIVGDRLAPLLQDWLRQQGYALQLPADYVESSAYPAGVDYQWLGLRILVGLGDFIPLPYPAPFAHLDQLAAHLPERQRSELEAKAGQILQALQDMIRGRDAFMPASRPIDPAMISAVQAAIAQRQSLTIQYQSPADAEPRYRRIQPLSRHRHRPHSHRRFTADAAKSGQLSQRLPDR